MLKGETESISSPYSIPWEPAGDFGTNEILGLNLPLPPTVSDLGCITNFFDYISSSIEWRY